jgi:hypothetical protein
MSGFWIPDGLDPEEAADEPVKKLRPRLLGPRNESVSLRRPTSAAKQPATLQSTLPYEAWIDEQVERAYGEGSRP